MKYLSLSSHCTLKCRCVCDCGCFQDYTWTSIVLRTSHHEQSGVTQLQNICQKKEKKTSAYMMLMFEGVTKMHLEKRQGSFKHHVTLNHYNLLGEGILDQNQVALGDQGLGLLCASLQPWKLSHSERSAQPAPRSAVALPLPRTGKKQSFPTQMTTSGQLNSDKHPTAQKEAEPCVSTTLKSLLCDCVWWSTIVLLICFQRAHLHAL